MPMSEEQIKAMQAKNAAEIAARAAARVPRTHEQRVELLLGWITAFTGIVAVGLVLSVLLALFG